MNKIMPRVRQTLGKHKNKENYHGTENFYNH